MHPILSDAADGRLPDWAQASPSRRDHMGRVADVMAGWGEALGLDAHDLTRWRATAMLHDALRDADPESLRAHADAPFAGLPDGLLHGPVAAARLEAEGVDDAPLLAAVRWHTLGHPELDRMGRALYVADYTEPGRRRDHERRAALRARLPEAMDAVVLEVARERLGLSLAGGHPLREPTVAFWNGLVAGKPGEPGG